MKNKQGFAPAAIVIVLAVLVIGGYFVWKNQTVTPPSALPEGEGTPASPLGGGLEGVEGWKTYRNDEYGFEFKYPTRWCAVDLEEGQRPSEDITCVDGGIYVVKNTKGMGGYDRRIISGKTAGDTGRTQVGSEMTRALFFTDPPLTVSMWYKLSVFDQENEQLEVMNRILSTFRFTE